MTAWKLDKGTERLCEAEDTEGSLSIESGKYIGMEVNITMNEVDRVEKILGVRLTLDEDDEK